MGLDRARALAVELGAAAFEPIVAEAQEAAARASSHAARAERLLDEARRLYAVVDARGHLARLG